MNRADDGILELVSELARRYRLAPLEPLLASCREVAAQDDLSVAVLGRFKAGKSSFLNHLLGRDVLPAGVTPVTAVVTEIVYGAHERAVVHFLDGRAEEVLVADIRGFVAEVGNPGNVKRVSRLAVELPALAPFGNLRFVDTPGLESALAHSTEETLAWLPRVGLALVAVSCDTPLSEHDLALLKSLRQYTPNVSVLLTKADLLTDSERAEVLDFMRAQLTRAFGSAPPIFPYSVRASGERFRALIEEELIKGALAEFKEQRRAALERKLETLLRECHDYLALALRAAESLASERAALARQVVGEKGALDDVKAELRLVVREARGGLRDYVSARLKTHRRELEERLLDGLKTEFPRWAKSLNLALESFEAWLRRTLSQELLTVSDEERARLVVPLEKLRTQVSRTLQNFRDRLSERAVRAYGVPLRTTELEIRVEEPRQPDVHIGRVFDRNWELLSPVIPMFVVRGLVERHFAGKVPYQVEKNLSRLTHQWGESVGAAMARAGETAERSLDELVGTVERLTAGGVGDAPRIRADIGRVASALNESGRAPTRQHV
ncbi:MAG: dynamin family protein [Acidobacteria bacterium]|nr:dynamin family protein [Acidobacteriota bacterium]